MGALEQLQEVARQRDSFARGWKARTGRGVVGYMCTYVPEEIVYAAGLLPVRVLGSRQPQDVSEAHIFGMFCPFCWDCLAQGLLGRYDYLDGLVTAHCCIHIRQAFDSWRRHIPLQYSHYVFSPAHIQSPRAFPVMAQEFQAFKASLEAWTGQAISQEALQGAIDVYNTNRRLLRQLYELRKQESPPISGVEAMEVVLAGMFMDKAEHNRLLQELLTGLPSRPGMGPGVRLMLIGSEDDDTQFVALAESLGARVVVDDHCTGTRYFWNEVPPGPDPLAALAQRYIDRPPCPTKDLVERRRLPHILALAQEWRVQGALLILQKFCDPHEFDLPVIRSSLQEHGIPSIFLEFDLTVPLGQFRSRIEALLEMLQMELV